jgi:hypothetical protein
VGKMFLRLCGGGENTVAIVSFPSKEKLMTVFFPSRFLTREKKKGNPIKISIPYCPKAKKILVMGFQLSS